MDLSRLFPVFHAVSWLHVVLALVEPPMNISLQCHNLNNVLRWSYKQLLPGLRFRVSIRSTLGLGSYKNEIWVEPPDLQANISFLSDPNNEYFLQVAAVINQDVSESVPQDGVTFSYFKDSLVNEICFVDLPSVNVTAQPDANILFRFEHPWLLYKDKVQSRSTSKHRNKKSHDSQVDVLLPEFKYTVVVIDQREHDFICEKSVCEERLAVDSQKQKQKHCLEITGELKKMAVKGTQQYCADPAIEPPTNNNYIYTVIGLVAGAVVVAVSFVVFMVYRKLTNPSETIPGAINRINNRSSNVSRTPEEQINVPELSPIIEVDPTTPTPLLPPQKKDTSSNGSLYHVPIRRNFLDEGVCDVMDVEQQDNGESGYMGGAEMEENCGYERRPIFAELGPDDRAEGYRG